MITNAGQCLSSRWSVNVSCWLCSLLRFQSRALLSGPGPSHSPLPRHSRHVQTQCLPDWHTLTGRFFPPQQLINMDDSLQGVVYNISFYHSGPSPRREAVHQKGPRKPLSFDSSDKIKPATGLLSEQHNLLDLFL